jgi:hypothetical protein
VEDPAESRSDMAVIDTFCSDPIFDRPISPLVLMEFFRFGCLADLLSLAFIALVDPENWTS